MFRALPLVALLACGPTESLDDTTDSAADSDLPAADTWSNFGEGFMATYCVECHDSGDKDYRQLADVIATAEDIRCGTAATTQEGCGTWPPANQFPIQAPYPSDAERDQLVAWIDAGMPE